MMAVVTLAVLLCLTAVLCCNGKATTATVSKFHVTNRNNNNRNYNRNNSKELSINTKKIFVRGGEVINTSSYSTDNTDSDSVSEDDTTTSNLSINDLDTPLDNSGLEVSGSPSSSYNLNGFYKKTGNHLH